MAKSSRSKWKKLHKRQRAAHLAETVSNRVSRLNGKLRLAANGGLSAVPTQNPETRFHFLNPEVHPNVPQSGGNGLHNNNDNNNNNNNKNWAARTRGDVVVDFSKPLRLAAAQTNFYGKSDTTQPHRMTTEFEIISASAPVAGHAFTAEDLSRAENNEANLSKNIMHHYYNENNKNNENENENENDDDGPAEFVLGCNDAAEETNVNMHKLLTAQPRHNKKSLATSSFSSNLNSNATNSAAAVVETMPHRIKSMETAAKGNIRVVAGDKKAKRLTNLPSTRLVKSGGKQSKKTATTTATMENKKKKKTASLMS